VKAYKAKVPKKQGFSKENLIPVKITALHAG